MLNQNHSKDATQRQDFSHSFDNLPSFRELSDEQLALIFPNDTPMGRRALARERDEFLLKYVRQPGATRNESGCEPIVVLTADALDYFTGVKRDAGLRHSTIQSSTKRLKVFAREFEYLPLDGDTIRERFLRRYATRSPRYQRNIFDCLADFYKTISTHYQLALNPMSDIIRPKGEGNTMPHPLKSSWLPALIKGAETDNEVAALGLQLGCGWRPAEFRSIAARDVREALYRDKPAIIVRGKERTELTPILTETLEVLDRLTNGLADDELIIRSKRALGGGVFAAMKQKAHTSLVRGLYTRAGVPDSFVMYDLRDTFGTEVMKASRDWFVTERLMRHVIPGEGKRYTLYPIEQLCDDLAAFTPMRHVDGGCGSVDGGTVFRDYDGEGGTRTPTHRCTRS